jgi:hypothetical protein
MHERVARYSDAKRPNFPNEFSAAPLAPAVALAFVVPMLRRTSLLVHAMSDATDEVLLVREVFFFFLVTKIRFVFKFNNMQLDARPVVCLLLFGCRARKPLIGARSVTVRRKGGAGRRRRGVASRDWRAVARATRRRRVRQRRRSVRVIAFALVRSFVFVYLFMLFDSVGLAQR